MGGVKRLIVALAAMLAVPAAGLADTRDAAEPAGLTPEAFGAVADGVADDSPAIQAALDRCHANGGGKVLLGAKRYRVARTITLTGGCVLSAPSWPGLQQGTGGYASLAYAIVLEPGATFTSASGHEVNQGLENILIINADRYRAGPPANFRAALTAIQAYRGTAVTLAGGQDFLLRDVTMLGFGTCVKIDYNQRPVFDHVYGDCTNGIVADHIYDVAKWRDLEFYPALLNYGNAMPAGTPGTIAIAVAGVTSVDGRYCLTAVAPNPDLAPATGDTVSVTGVGGAVGANGRFTITVGARGCAGLLLNESVVAPAPSVTIKAGDPWIALDQAPAQWVYWPGQRVRDGAGLIPAGAVIDRVWIGKRLIHVSTAPTGSGGTRLAIANPPATTGGTLRYSLGTRAGVAYQVTNATGVLCWNCFEYGYRTGFHIGRGAVGVNLTGGGVDSDNALGDPTSIGILIDGTASAVQFIGQTVNAVGRAVVAQNTGSDNLSPNLFVGGQYATTTMPGGGAGTSFELNGAWAHQLSGLAIAGDIQIADAVTLVQYGGIFGPGAQPAFQSDAARARTRQDGTSSFAAGAPPVGAPVFDAMTAGTIHGAATGLRIDVPDRLGVGIGTPPAPGMALTVGGAIAAGTFVRMGSTTVAGLVTIDPVPAAGDRAMVTDAAACIFGAAVVGGAARRCPVVYDGKHWIGG